MLNSALLAKLQSFRIRSKRSKLIASAGSRLSLRRGQGIEFADYRPYATGDDTRYLDWRVFARTDRYFIKEFRAEQSLKVLILLDLSSSMTSDEKKFTRMKDLVLALGYLVLSGGDELSVGLLAEKEQLIHFRGRSGFEALRKLVEKVSPSGSLKKEMLYSVVQKERTCGRIIFLSDLFFLDLATTITPMFRRGVETSIIQVLSSEDLAPQLGKSLNLIDAESGEALMLEFNSTTLKEYQNFLAEFTQIIVTLCRQNSGHFIRVSAEEDLNEVLFNRFIKEGIVE